MYAAHRMATQRQPHPPPACAECGSNDIYQKVRERADAFLDYDTGKAPCPPLQPLLRTRQHSPSPCMLHTHLPMPSPAVGPAAVPWLSSRAR